MPATVPPEKTPHHRTGARTLRAIASPHYYRAIWNIFRFFRGPVRVLSGYLTLSQAGYPRTVVARAPTGQVRLRLYSPDDLVTAVECFAKIDYATPQGVTRVVDMGANIGISAAYFLSRNDVVTVDLFEPLPRNLARLEENLEPFRSRYRVQPVAIGTSTGKARFGVESTGRYGGIGLDFEESTVVEVLDANEALAAVLVTTPAIDVLKLDIEGMEAPVLAHLDPRVLERVALIYAETPDPQPSLDGFSDGRQGGVAVYTRQG